MFDIRINDDEVLVFFDVVLLFIVIFVNKACDYIKKKLEDDIFFLFRINLNISDIIFLFNFILSNNYFVFNDKIYK